jgi:anti-anti-sigma factor
MDTTGGTRLDVVHDGTTLVLRGDFDAQSTFEVRNALHLLLAGHEQDVVVDLTEVSRVDVIALKVLAFATHEAGRAGHHVTLRGCGPAVRRLLHKSRLIRLVELEREAATA